MNMARNKPITIGECFIPAYAIKTIGSRHFLVAGGGGGARTGVRNEIMIFLLTYDQLTCETPGQARTLKAKLTGIIDTTEFANMNMDVLALQPQSGKYLVAVGHDEKCTIYESVGFCIGDECQSLSLQFRGVCRWETDFRNNNNKDPFQKRVKLFRRNTFIYVACGGEEGHVRVWDTTRFPMQYLRDAIDASDELIDTNDALRVEDVDTGSPLVDISVGAAVVDLDVSASGDVLATIAGRNIVLWSVLNGKELAALPVPNQLVNAEFRGLKFLNLDKKNRNEILVCAFNQRKAQSRSVESFLALYAFEKSKSKCHLIIVQKTCNEFISSLTANESGDFIAFGTMDGSVGVFDAHNMADGPAYLAHKCHSSFVTAVDFLPQRTYDASEWGRISAGDMLNGGSSQAGHLFLPGVCSADARIAVLSISVDNSIQMHQVGYPFKSSVSGSLVRLLVLFSFLYMLLWFLFLY